MALNRREFLKIMGGTAAALAFPGVMFQGCKKALEKAAARTNIIWIEGLSCSGCSVSLLNKLNPDILSVITEHISLNYQGVVMAGTGSVATRILEEAVKKKRKDFVLIVEGSIPTKNDLFCTIGENEETHRGIGVRHWVEELGKNAMAVVSVGTCSAYGGIPSAKSPVFGDNQTGAVSVQEILKDKVVLNIPGCPPHPDWMVGTLLHVLLKGMPELDGYNRPKMFYGKTVHEQCERLYYYKRGIFAKEWGDGPGCLYNLGCLGMDSGCDIPVRKWNNGASSCTECGSGCIGCTEKVFPDYGRRGIYQNLHAEQSGEKPESAGILSKVLKGEVING